MGAVVFLASCHFDDAVFTEDLAKVDGSLSGIWITHEKAHDPRTAQFALCVPIDGDRCLLHHPARGSDSFYYEARPVNCRDRTLLQLRVLSTFKGGAPDPASKRFTLLWVERKAGDRLVVRAIDGKGSLSGISPAEARKALTDPTSDWEAFFDDGQEYRCLKNPE